jgi:glycosyltransferase involved in cell wall biosynthesis
LDAQVLTLADAHSHRQPALRVAFGATLLTRGLAHNALDGIGYYAAELARRLAQRSIALDPVDFSGAGIYFQDLIGPLAEIFQVSRGFRLPDYRALASLSAAFGVGFPEQCLVDRGVELYHATDHLVPRFTKLPVVATIMDTIPVSEPQWANPRLRGLKNLVWRRAVSWADHVITISSWSADCIAREFKIPSRRISVVPLGVDERYAQPIPHEVEAAVRSKFKIQRPFFLCLGTITPRKNLEMVVRAMESSNNTILKGADVLIAGRHGWGCQALMTALSDAQDDAPIRWLGSVTDLEKRVLLRSAIALVFPSLSEGFGLPIVEAFASGLPVICANQGASLEVAGDAAALVDPLDASELAAAMRELFSDQACALALRAKGFDRVQRYTWRRCADRTLEVYRHTLGMGKQGVRAVA